MVTTILSKILKNGRTHERVTEIEKFEKKVIHYTGCLVVLSFKWDLSYLYRFGRGSVIQNKYNTTGKE